MNALEAIRSLRRFAETIQVTWRGKRRSWAEHIDSDGYDDEETILRPHVFPSFAAAFLDFRVGENLAPEVYAQDVKPDFTPADLVTHPFIFETKSTRFGPTIAGHDSQVRRYLTEGRPQIRRVVLTNLVGIRVFELSGDGGLTVVGRINLALLLAGPESAVVDTPDAHEFVRFVSEFAHQALSPQEKLDRVRRSPEWNPLLEVTSGDWMSRRVDRVVSLLQANVAEQLVSNVLDDRSRVNDQEREQVLTELQHLEWRIGTPLPQAEGRSLADYLTARGGSPEDKALRQYQAHVAYYAATRLMLVRTWEDLGLLPPTLHDGGFDQWMKVFNNVIDRVIAYSFSEARSTYRALFDRRNVYSWFEPTADIYASVIYELANTYFGAIESDILGEVYERLLERIDRKLLGQYYTPRDIIRFIWELIDLESIAMRAEDSGRQLRVLDIATGSGGFLVEAARQLRARLDRQVQGGARITRQEWLSAVADGLNGVEIQRFPAYLAELNLLIQLGQVAARGEGCRIPTLGILATDTLSLHNPHLLFGEDVPADVAGLAVLDAGDREDKARRIKAPMSRDFLMDVACGNPPYVGQKLAAPMMQRTRHDYPYWESFVGPHMDYLYWFLILGVSKLRQGGRFGFITTEYWLRAEGAKPLRRYLAAVASVERILLFRSMRLFPDAPGQHSMVIIGERSAPYDGQQSGGIEQIEPSYPRVSVYTGPSISVSQRAGVLEVMRQGRSALSVRSFRSSVSPNTLGEASWAEVVLSPAQFRRRESLRDRASPLALDTEEGFLTSADRMRKGYDDQMTTETLRAIGWPSRKAGIFVLTGEEKGQLGNLAEAENALLRPVVNTKDVFPYAAVVDEQCDWMIYLAAPNDIEPSLSDHQVQNQAFPDGLDRLETHLRRFRPLLLEKVDRYGERRPWWSIHRPRPEIVAKDRPTSEWADYCLTARWGGGQRLVVGLAPGGIAPASGLHALFSTSDGSAAYVSGLMNSSRVQELTESLPPGQLRAADLYGLGLPFLPSIAQQVERHARELAVVVRVLVGTLTRRFPQIPMKLLEDVSFEDNVCDTWVPESGPSARWGSLERVHWVRRLDGHGAQTVRVTSVDLVRGLFGLAIEVRGGPSSVRIELGINEGDETNALLAAIRGLAASGGRLTALRSLQVPLEPQDLRRAYEADCRALRNAQDRYVELRGAVDGLVEDSV